MKYPIKILFLLVFTGSLFSQTRNDRAQRELETLEKLSSLIESGRASESEAKSAILNFHYDTKADVRKLSSKLATNEIELMRMAQEVIWDATVKKLLVHYENSPYGYERFLRNQYEVLLKYNDVIMVLLHYGIDNELSDDFAPRVIESVRAVNAVWGDF